VLTNRVTRGVAQAGAWRATPWQIWMLAQLRPSVVTASSTRHLRDELRHHRYVTTASRAPQQPCFSLHTRFGRVWCTQSPKARELIARANLMGVDGSRGFCSSIFTLRPLWTAEIVRSLSEGTNSARFVRIIRPSICIFCPTLSIIMSRGTHQSPNARGLIARGPFLGRRVWRFSFFDNHLSSVMDGYDFPIGQCRNGVCPICPSGLYRDNTLSVDLHLSSYGFDHSVTRQRIPHAPSRGRYSY
jgi:hypothetical protein